MSSRYIEEHLPEGSSSMETHHIHHGRVFTVITTWYDSWTLEVQVQGLPRHIDSDNSYPTREAAEAAGLDIAHRLIDDKG
jgi:hypothetical protein